MPLELRRF